MIEFETRRSGRNAKWHSLYKKFIFLFSVSQHEIRRLYQRFSILDKDGLGHITKKEFNSIPELAVNPLAERIFCQFNKNKTGYINFKDFLYAFDIFHEGVEKSQKAQFTFKLYDVNNDGFIDSDDLMYVLKLLVGKNMDDVELLKIVQQTLKETDRDGDGKLNFEEFQDFLKDFDFDKNMNIDF
jgi:serine/threonine-protein phosphatase 2B regulatory subunit